MSGDRIDLAVIGGVVVDGGRQKRADVYINNGLIEAVESGNPPPAADRVIDASGKFVLPGIIDAHLHPVYADRIEALSRAAACGGATTLVPYIGAVKAWGQSGGLLEAIEAFIEEGERDSILDFGVHCTLTQNSLEEAAEAVPRLIERGVVSFKAFTAYKKRGMKLEDDELLYLMNLISAGGGLLGIHAENGYILDHLEESHIARKLTAPEYFPPAHPNISEAEAVFRVLSLARVSGCRMFLPHLSARESLDVVALFKKWGEVDISTETCPHYLTLTEAEMKKWGSLAKMSPPLRSEADIEALWEAVDGGLIDVIGSDAAGHDKKANEPIWDEVFSAPNGIPGVDTMFMVVYDEGVNRGRTTLTNLVRLLCENPARVFGLYPRKGTLQKGSDADLVVFDPTVETILPERNPSLKVDYSLYAGRRCLGAPELVIRRGEVIAENGRASDGPGPAQYLPGRLN